MTRLFIIVVCLLTSLRFFAQDTIRALHSVTIYKTVNKEGKRANIFIEVDSAGNVFINNTKTKFKFDVKKFAKEINTYVVTERIDKYPGNDDISFIEPPTPQLNKQNIVISIMFLDDVTKEKKLRNKTYYSWGRAYDKENESYPILQYLSETEIDTLKSLLK